MESKHILIVGAGAAGLMAGCELIEKGYKVTIIEARERTGGRICTLNNYFSMPADIGAEFVHGDKKITSQITKAAGLRLVKMKGEMYRIENGALKESDFFDGEWGSVVKKLNSLSHDMDMSTFMDVHFNRKQHPELYNNIRAFVEGYDAADLHKVSAYALRDEWAGTDDDKQFHIEDGYSGIMDYLAAKFKHQGGEIRLSSPVRDIHWSEGKVTLTTRKEEDLQGDIAIITVPLGVLIYEKIFFSPSLGEYQKAFHDIGYGGVIKFLIEFEESYWQRLQREAQMEDLSFVFTDYQIPTWWSQSPNNVPLITGWLGGPDTTTISHDKNELFKIATSCLATIFKTSVSEITANVKRWYIANWLEDEFTLGAYSYPTTKSQEAKKLLSTPLKDTLYFAGEAIFDGPDMGTVEAALESGKQVAEKIISAS